MADKHELIKTQAPKYTKMSVLARVSSVLFATFLGMAMFALGYDTTSSHPPTVTMYDAILTGGVGSFVVGIVITETIVPRIPTFWTTTPTLEHVIMHRYPNFHRSRCLMAYLNISVFTLSVCTAHFFFLVAGITGHAVILAWSVVLSLQGDELASGNMDAIMELGWLEPAFWGLNGYVLFFAVVSIPYAIHGAWIAYRCGLLPDKSDSQAM